MIPVSEQASIRHIVVTLDASESGRPVLETAVRLATVLGAKLEGVFVEDINLIRLEGLPFLRELRTWSLAEEKISTQRMQRELRALARQAERMLEQAAREKDIPWSFQIWRGHAGAASLTQAFGADILSQGRAGSLISSRMRTRSHARAHRYKDAIAAISVLFSHSEQAARAMTTACRLAKDPAARLTVLLPDDPAEDIEGLKEKARIILDAHNQPASFVQLAGSDMQTLNRMVSTRGICIFITEAKHPLLQEAGIDQCLDILSCPVLLVR